MVDWVGQYYCSPFQVSHKVAQGDPLFPNIFSMMVDAVIWNWVTLVAEKYAVPECFRSAIQWIAEFLTPMRVS